MNKTNKFLAFALALIMCFSLIPIGVISVIAEGEDEVSSHVYMIVTNPGEDCRTQMRIGFHSDYTYTGCNVQYTTADDPCFDNAITVNGTYDDQKYLWFYNRLTTNSLTDNRLTTKFLDWGVELDGLTPDTDYIYRVYDGVGAYSETYNFKTAGADEYTIIWMSDAHINADYTGRLNAWNNMFKYAESVAKYDVAFQFSTGDSTTSGDRYQDWQTIFNQDFTKNYMLANLVGNHDVYDSIMDDDTIYYTQYWKSGQYFEIVNNNPRNGFTANSQRISGYLSGDEYSAYAGESANYMLDVDSGKHAGKQITGALDNTDGRFYWFNYNGILFIIFDYYSMMFAEDTKNALDWAGRVIEQNYGKYDYIVCASHINLVNGGGGEFRDYGALDYDYFGPFFDKYDVDLYLAGDNHVYLRTDAIYNGAVTTEPGKGTHIIQAPCLSRPQSFDAYNASGYAVKQYSVKGTTVGGLTIDVDEDGLTFNCLVYEMLGTTPYYCYDSFTVPKKDRAPSAQVGLYEFKGEVDLLISTDPNSVFATSDAGDGALIYCYHTFKNYGLFATSEGPVWVDVSDATYVADDGRQNKILENEVVYGLTEINGDDGVYTAEAFSAARDAIVADKGDGAAAYLDSLLSGKNLYVFTANEGKPDELAYVSGAYLVFDNQITGEDLLSLDLTDVTYVAISAEISLSAYDNCLLDVNNSKLYMSFAEIVDETAPDEIVYKDDEGLLYNAAGCTVEYIDKIILNAKVVVTTPEGKVLKPWEYIPNGSDITVYNGNSETPVGVIEDLYIDTYTVKFFTEDFSLIEEQIVSAGCDAVPPEAPAKEGFEHAGWTGDSCHNVTSNRSLTAYYIESSETDDPENPGGGSYTPVYGGNRLLGESYTYTAMNSFQGACKDESCTLLTDGAYRGDGTNAFNGMSAVPFVSVELAGTYQENIIDFTLNGGRDIASVVIRGTRKVNENNSVNRHLSIASIYVSTDGLSFTPVEFTVSEEAIKDAPEFSPDNGVTNYKQYYDMTATFSQTYEGVVGMRVIINTARADGSRAYIVQLDEVAAYGPEGCTEVVRPDAPVDEPSEDASSEEPSEDVSSEEPSEDIPSVSEPSEDPSVSEPSEDEPVLDITYGDVNGDGFIDSLDAAQNLKHDAMLIVLAEDAIAAADVNGDGFVDSLDAAQILKFDAMLIDSFPVQNAE